jgi:hypothetical protein
MPFTAISASSSPVTFFSLNPSIPFMNTLQLTEETENTFLSGTESVQVKMFIHNNPKDAEKAIAQWLKQNHISIRHITQSQSEKNGSFVFVVSVFYRQLD